MTIAENYRVHYPYCYSNTLGGIPHPGFFLGHNMEKPPTPKIYEVKPEPEQESQNQPNKLYL
ncbi:hypothetical protein ABLO26_02635 [Neobacillus sp. 179-J 1A1 HS]